MTRRHAGRQNVLPPTPTRIFGGASVGDAACCDARGMSTFETSQRTAVSPVRRRVRVCEPVSCPSCGLDLTHAPLVDRERHADGCERALTQLDEEDERTRRAEEDGVAIEGGLVAWNALEEPDDTMIALVDALEARRGRATNAETSALSGHRTEKAGGRTAIGVGETIEQWLTRLGMAKYYHAVFVKEDLLEVRDARECSKEDFMSVGVSEVDADVLAFCGETPQNNVDVNDDDDSGVKNRVTKNTNVDATNTDTSREKRQRKPRFRASGAMRQLPTNTVFFAPRTRARLALESAKAAALNAEEKLWHVAAGTTNRGRGDSLPSIDRFRTPKM